MFASQRLMPSLVLGPVAPCRDKSCGAFRVQDVVLPAIADQRLPDDAIVFVAEHDFRFFERDDISPEEWLPMCAAEDPAAVAQDVWDVLPGQVRAHEAALKSQDADALQETRRGRFGHMLAQVRPQPDDPVSPELADLVAYCNAARKKGRDGLVWLGWNGGDPEATGAPKRTTHIKFGSQLIALTPVFARLLLARMRAERKGDHLDRYLKGVLLESEELNSLSCYVQPAIGGFGSSHTSMNLQRARKGPWKEKWCLQGTNPINSGVDRPGPSQRRYLCQFVRRGPAAYLGDHVSVPYQDTELFHKTLRPSDGLLNADAQYMFLLRSMGWVTEGGAWLGPWGTEDIRWTEPRWKGSGKCANLSRREIMNMTSRDDYWRRLQESPEERPPRPGAEADRLLSRLAFEIATSSGGGHSWHHDTRAGREGRFAREQYRRRFFVDDPDEAWAEKKTLGPHCIMIPMQA